MGALQSTLFYCRAPASDRPLPYGVSKTSKTIQLNSSYTTLYNGIVSLAEDNKYVDLLLFCGDLVYPVHRAIVCPRSRYFERQCVAASRDNDLASPGNPMRIWIDTSDCGPCVLEAALTFLYTLDYPSLFGKHVLNLGYPAAVMRSMTVYAQHPQGPYPPTYEASQNASEGGVEAHSSLLNTPASSDTQSTDTTAISDTDPRKEGNELLFHLLVYLAGLKFGIRALCDVSEDKFDKQLSGCGWFSWWTTDHELIACIRVAYTQKDDLGLAGVKEKTIVAARTRQRSLAKSPEWEELLTLFPQFAAAVLRQR